MKKILILLLSILVFATGCTTKKVDGDNFKTYMEKKGFKIYDLNKQYDGELVSSAILASNEENGYDIEFLVFKSDDYAKNAFQANRTAFRELKKSDDKEDSVSKEKTSKYYLTTKDTYYVISRKNNTLVYAICDGSYKNDVNKILKDLGY